MNVKHLNLDEQTKNEIKWAIYERLMDPIFEAYNSLQITLDERQTRVNRLIHKIWYEDNQTI